jgi:hypothetical protein
VRSQETDGVVGNEDKEKQVSHRADLSLFTQKINLLTQLFYQSFRLDSLRIQSIQQQGLLGSR